MDGLEWNEEKEKYDKIKIPKNPWNNITCEHCRYGMVVQFTSNPPQFGYILCQNPKGIKGVQLRKHDFCSHAELPQE